MRYIAIALMILVGSCASNPPIVALGDGRLMVAKAAMTKGSGVGTLRAQALEDASMECGKRQRVAQIETQQESGKWYVPGDYRKLEITFRCIDAKIR